MPKDEDTNDATNGQPSQQTDTFADSEVVIQRLRGMDDGSSKCGPSDGISSKYRCGVLRITERKVQENALHNQENAATHDHDSDSRYDPMDIGSCCPREKEKSYREKE